MSEIRLPPYTIWFVDMSQLLVERGGGFMVRGSGWESGKEMKYGLLIMFLVRTISFK